ncbi:hypothetical protein [Xylanimonas protaetiae]|uniref:Uncharacterized protein n=1 Tax=Xylanimonas protaetiae TaxID=2509457 RepID=A0A4P6F6S0_9MICO|nr:hypothetical protein [Xylanimonas protaetiae]QAY70029.1 hypothetical protein ET471_08265 [Xylanimonas protaetiae]
MIPQHGKSTHPDVLAAVDLWWSERKRGHDQVLAFAAKYSDAEKPSAYAGVRIDWFNADGITGPIKPGNGQWKVNGHGYAPYKSNPVNKEFEATFVKLPAIPGLPAIMFSADQSHFLYPRAFVWDGAAYYSLPQPAHHDEGDTERTADYWTEILASEYHRAHEFYTGKAVAA